MSRQLEPAPSGPRAKVRARFRQRPATVVLSVSKRSLTVRTNYFESVDHPGKDGDMRQNAKWPLLSSPPPRLAGWSSLEAGRVELSSAITPPSTSSTLASAELDVVNHDEAPPLQL